MLVTISMSAQIAFVADLTFEEIKEKAKKENKLIFLDIYTTWCVPCKKMDVEVYPDKAVGDYFNSRFISVKSQMDRTPNDNAAR